jgi:hypothetical protein
MSRSRADQRCRPHSMATVQIRATWCDATK